MKRKYTSQELFDLRNRISIRYLIEKILDIPTRDTRGVFRFRCPRCESFHTSVNPKTNLSRCFDCAINFNTIEMVMTVKGVKFTDSVKFLRQIMARHRQDGPFENEGMGNKSPDSLPLKVQHDASEGKKKTEEPVIIGSVLQNIPELKAAPDCASVDRDFMGQSPCLMIKRIEKLEQQVTALDARLEQLKTFVIQFVTGK